MEENIAKYFKALGDKNRLILFEWIFKGENCGCTLINKLNITQPTMTYHLNILEEAGLITSRKEGIWRKLEINHNNYDELKNYLLRFEKSRGCKEC